MRIFMRTHTQAHTLENYTHSPVLGVETACQHSCSRFDVLTMVCVLCVSVCVKGGRDIDVMVWEEGNSDPVTHNTHITHTLTHTHSHTHTHTHNTDSMTEDKRTDREIR